MSIKNNLTFIIVTYESDNVIDDCLSSIPNNYPIIVIENSRKKNFQEKIDVRKLRYYLDRTELYIGKVSLRIFNYTYEIIRNLRPAEFFILYLDACKLLGLYHDNFLIFEDVDIELITKHKNEIDKDIV